MSSPHEPTLRLRFDPPPEAPPEELGGVLSDVEQLSHGIDSMLYKASQSAIGVALTQSDATVEDDDPDFEGDDPMIAMFDEDTPSDIHSIDRMLADEARKLLPNTMGMQADDEVEETTEHEIAAAKLALGQADGASAPESAASAEPEVSLEGDFESFESLIGSLPSLSLPAPVVAKAALAVSDPLPSESNSEAPVASQVTNSAKPTAPILSSTPTVALEHTQAAGLASVSIPGPAEHAPTVAASPATSNVVSATPKLIVETSSTPGAAMTNGSFQTPDVAPPSTMPARQSHSGPVLDHPASTAVSAPADSTAGQRRNPFTGIVQMLSLTNLPLRLLPPSMKPMVNMLALSLLAWAPAIWTLAPHLAARQAAAAMEMIEAPAHGESTLKTEGADGGAEHGSSGHSGAKPESKKKTTAAKKSGGKSDVKAKAKKTDAGHASGGEH